MANDRDEDAAAGVPVEEVSVEELREQYEREMMEKAEQGAQQALQRRREEVMLALTESERLSEDDLISMVRLGVVAEDEDFLPCNDGTRQTSSADWDEQYEEHLERKEKGLPEEDEPGKARIDPTEVCCPLMSDLWFHQDPRPCIEAQHEQQEHYALEDLEDEPKYLDPDDPVVEVELRPCLVLGDMTLGALFGNLQRRKEQRSVLEVLNKSRPRRGPNES